MPVLKVQKAHKVEQLRKTQKEQAKTVHVNVMTQMITCGADYDFREARWDRHDLRVKRFLGII